jgi:hypothetical protein
VFTERQRYCRLGTSTTDKGAGSQDLTHVQFTQVLERVSARVSSCLGEREDVEGVEFVLLRLHVLGGLSMSCRKLCLYKLLVDVGRNTRYSQKASTSLCKI